MRNVTNPKKNYTNKTVYLGIDVHKKTYAIAAVCDGQVVKRDTIKAEPERLVSYCSKYFVGAIIESAYEAGFTGFHLHRYLTSQGINNIVVDAAGIEIAANNRVKTDKRDSLKIASHLSEGRLKGIHIPSVEREDNRAVTRIREVLSRQKTRTACQLKALLYQHGLIAADNTKKISEKWLRIIESLLLPRGLRFALGELIDLWRFINARIKKIDKEIELQAERDNVLEMVYRSAPGVGPTSARILANELEDTLQFNNERQIFSYVGLTPSEHSSGDNKRQGHITRQGKPILRKILVQAAWKAIKIDASLEEIFNRLAAKTGKNKAIIGIARRLIGRIRSCFRKGNFFEIKKINKNMENLTLPLNTELIDMKTGELLEIAS